MVQERFRGVEEVTEQYMGFSDLNRTIPLQCGLAADAVVCQLAMSPETVTVRHERKRRVMPSSESESDRSAILVLYARENAHNSEINTMRGLSEYFALRLSSRSLAPSRELSTMVGVRKSLK